MDERAITSTEVEDLNLQFDERLNQCEPMPKLTDVWDVHSVHSMPYEDEAIDEYARAPNPFRICRTRKHKHRQIALQDAQNYSNRMANNQHQRSQLDVAPVYCNSMSTLIYAENIPLIDEEDENNAYMDQRDPASHDNSRSLRLCFLTKNEGSYCFAREQLSVEAADYSRFRQGAANIDESFSMVLIRKLRFEDDEFIVQIKHPNEDNGSVGGFLSAESDINLQRMLGANAALKLDPRWDVGNARWYMPLSLMEK